jgi:hypothetical protein
MNDKNQLYTLYFEPDEDYFGRTDLLLGIFNDKNLMVDSVRAYMRQLVEQTDSSKYKCRAIAEENGYTLIVENKTQPTIKYYHTFFWETQELNTINNNEIKLTH